MRPRTEFYSKKRKEMFRFLFDIRPPGNKVSKSGSWSNIASTYSDLKNSFRRSGRVVATPMRGPNTPPLRPNHSYYLGVFAHSDATFNISSSASAETIGTLPTVDFYGGLIDISLDPAESRYFRVSVPEDAARWVSYGTHSSSVQFLSRTDHCQHQAGAARAVRVTGASTSHWAPGLGSAEKITISSSRTAVAQRKRCNYR